MRKCLVNFPIDNITLENGRITVDFCTKYNEWYELQQNLWASSGKVQLWQDIENNAGYLNDERYEDLPDMMQYVFDMVLDNAFQLVKSKVYPDIKGDKVPNVPISLGFWR